MEHTVPFVGALTGCVVQGVVGQLTQRTIANVCKSRLEGIALSRYGEDGDGRHMCCGKR
jgi:hypothetical protein